MAKNAYLNLNIRVCGAETVNLVSSSTRNYIHGVVLGSISGMSDSTRYILIPQSTFQSWFSVSPSNDPCTIDQYSIWSSVQPLQGFPDAQVLLTGSLGNYMLKIDKTMATNTRTFYLRARTRGLNTVDQRVTFVICPKTGGLQIGPPSAYLPNIVDTTNGGKVTL